MKYFQVFVFKVTVSDDEEARVRQTQTHKWTQMQMRIVYLQGVKRADGDVLVSIVVAGPSRRSRNRFK